jgi:small multidrug resistance pump
MERPTPPPSVDRWKWISFVLFLAGAYNVAWGAVALLAPRAMLGAVGIEGGFNQILWQCIGMLVGLYGVMYWFAAADPMRHWPIIVVGLVGKLLGPVRAA